MLATGATKAQDTRNAKIQAARKRAAMARAGMVRASLPVELCRYCPAQRPWMQLLQLMCAVE